MRVVSFLIVVIVSVAAPWWFLLLLAAAYALFFGGLELVVLGVLLDGYFGYAGQHVLYTVAAAALSAAAATVRPRIALLRDARAFSFHL